MTTPGRRRKRLTERLRAIARGSDASNDGARRHSRITTANFERSHRSTVWIPPDPPLSQIRREGSEPMTPTMKRKWF